MKISLLINTSVILYFIFQTGLFAQQTSKNISKYSNDLKEYRNQNSVPNPKAQNRNIINVLPDNGSLSNSGRAPQGSRLFINTCYIIRPSEMTASGFGADTVKSVGWTWEGSLSQNISTKGTLKVYLQSTTDTAYNKGTNFSTALSGMTKIIDDSISIPAGLGPFNIHINIGGPGTSSFITASGQGVYLAFEYKTTSTLAAPLGAPTVLCSSILNNGCATYQSQSANGTLLTTSAFRPKTNFGNNEIDPINISAVYALGKIPINFGCPDTLGIRLKKNLAEAFDVKLIIKVQKLDPPFVTKDSVVQIISTPGTFDTLIKYEIPCQPVLQRDYILFNKDRVIIEAIAGEFLNESDVTSIDFSDIEEYCQYSTYDVYNYVDPCKPIEGGVGINNSSGNMVARFNNYSANIFPLHAVEISFYENLINGSQPYKIIIYGDNGSGKPGTLLYSSPTLTTPPVVVSSQPIEHVLTSPVNIAANSRFYVGVRQNSSTNIGLSFQDENPVRPKVFFYSVPDTSNTWIDFSTAGANYRLDIMPRAGSTLNLISLIEGFYYPGPNIMISDTVNVFLRNISSPYSMIDTAKGILNSSGTGTFGFLNAIPGINYYIVVKHRNSIETWSKSSGISFSNGTASYNFTLASSQAFGSNLVQVGGGYAIYSGDVNQDGVVDVSDISAIDNDTFNFESGYRNTDLDGNQVIDISDAAIGDNNAFNFVATVHP